MAVEHGARAGERRRARVGWLAQGHQRGRRALKIHARACPWRLDRRCDFCVGLSSLTFAHGGRSRAELKCATHTHVSKRLSKNWVSRHPVRSPSGYLRARSQSAAPRSALLAVCARVRRVREEPCRWSLGSLTLVNPDVVMEIARPLLAEMRGSLIENEICGMWDSKFMFSQSDGGILPHSIWLRQQST